YYAAFGLPDLLFTLIAGGALASAFIPIFSAYLSRDDRSGAWRLASAVINTAFIVSLIASIVLASLAPWIVTQTVGRGFTVEQQQLTANLMRVILIGTVVFSISGIFMSALQANQHFILPALAPVMYNLGILGGVIFLTPRYGVWGPAIGVVVGAVLHLLIQVPGLIKYHARWTPRLDWSDPDLRRVIKLMLPRIAGLGVVQLAAIIATSLASTLSAGSVTALRYGWQVMQLPETLIATAIATAAFPTLSEFAARKQFTELRATLSSTLRAILLLTVPATLALLILGRPAVQLLFERGKFTSDATDLVTFAVQGYAIGLIGQSLLEVCARTFYAQQDTATPLFVAIGAMAVNILASVILKGTLGVGGLALANSIGVTIEVLGLLIILRHRLRGVDGRRIARSILKFAAGSIGMLIVVLIAQSIFISLPLHLDSIGSDSLRSALERGLPLIAASILGAIVYVILMIALRSEELIGLRRSIGRRSPIEITESAAIE
ncbi:MAG TPA: murein biosynthesis integral membrane protein MurJ, partial [Anaerolineae bacterium]|nr:murein biosynthesis integral membrane protein MurJ [Anaerolineae bacterium]